MADDDLLKEVQEYEIPEVLQTMKKKWPQHFLLHQYITVMEDYKITKKKLHQVLYRYGDIEEGIYILCSEFPFGTETKKLYLPYTKSTDLTSLSKVLKETSRIPWFSKEFFFEVTLNRFTPTITESLTAIGVKDFSVVNNIMMYFPPEVEIQMRELPEDVYLDFLNESHVPELDKNWSVRSPGSDEYLLLEIKNNFGLGLFRKSDKKLLSSAVCFHNGGIYVLYSDPEFRGKGYADIIVRNMVKEIRKLGRIPFDTIVLKNIPSQNLFKKIGFKEFDRINFIMS